MKIPTPDEIRTARKKSGLTQEQAGKLVYVTMTSWMRYETAKSNIHPGLFELFLIKTGQRRVNK